MTPRSRLVAGSLLLLVGITTSGCGNDQDTAARPGSGTDSGAPTQSLPPSPPSGTAATGNCPAVITPQVLAGLGWDSGQDAVEGRGGCEWVGSEGTVTVFQSGQSFEEACARTEDAAADGTFEPAVSGAGDDPTCGYTATTGTGASEFVVESAGEVVSITIVAKADTDPDRVREALLDLTSSVGQL